MKRSSILGECRHHLLATRGNCRRVGAFRHYPAQASRQAQQLRAVRTHPLAQLQCRGRSVVAEAMAPSSSSAAKGATADRRQRAVVVGAGPAGTLAAMLLAKQGFQVDVYERSAPFVDSQGRVQASIGPRSYNLLLAERAAAALEQAGVELGDFDAPAVSCTLRHKLKGGPADGRPSMPEGRLTISNRGVLAGALVQQCQSRHGDSITFHFHRALHSLDAEKGTASFQLVNSTGNGAAAAASSVGSQQQQQQPGQDGAPATVAFDLLVGADGSGSAVRHALVQQDSTLKASQTRDVMEFKTFLLGPAEQFLPPGSSPVGTFQTWSNAKLNATIIGSSTGDGQLRCVFILPEGVHGTLQTAADYESYITDHFPSLPADAVKRAAPQLAESPLSNGGLITRCTKLNSGRVVLVGDAAHSVYPALGQGANAALEGAAAFGTVLQEMGTEKIEAVGAEYSRRWLPNAIAVADLTEEGFGNNRRAVTFNLKLAQLISQMLLHKVLPFLVPKPIFFQLNSTSIPYATIMEKSKKEMSVFKGVLGAVVAALLAWLVMLARRAMF